jgi:two-component system, response regulator YesN
VYQILIVDDEPSVLSVLKKVIGTDDRFVCCAEAYSVKQAISRMADCLPDVLITDIRMPGETGIELLRHLSSHNAETLSVVLSGYDNFDYVHDAFIFGAEEYLLKPLDPKRLLRLLDNIAVKLDKRQTLIAGEKPEKPESTENVRSGTDALVARIDRYLTANLSEDNSIVAICRRFAISQPTLSKIMKKAKGCTYNEYLISLKIAHAKALLAQRPDLLVAEVSDQSGFSDQFYFSRVFKNVTGMTPTDYRNRHNA